MGGKKRLSPAKESLDEDVQDERSTISKKKLNVKSEDDAKKKPSKRAKAAPKTKAKAVKKKKEVLDVESEDEFDELSFNEDEEPVSVPVRGKRSTRARKTKINYTVDLVDSESDGQESDFE